MRPSRSVMRTGSRAPIDGRQAGAADASERDVRLAHGAWSPCAACTRASSGSSQPGPLKPWSPSIPPAMSPPPPAENRVPGAPDAVAHRVPGLPQGLERAQRQVERVVDAVAAGRRRAAAATVRRVRRPAPGRVARALARAVVVGAMRARAARVFGVRGSARAAGPGRVVAPAAVADRAEVVAAPVGRALDRLVVAGRLSARGPAGWSFGRIHDGYGALWWIQRFA